MIIGNFYKENKNYKEIEIKGHADFNESGKDIVCAAVSTAIIVSLNALELLDLNKNYQFQIDEGYFKLEVTSNHDTLEKLLKNLEYTLKDLEQQYPNYIKNQKEG